MEKVLYIRIDAELWRKLERMRREESKKKKGMGMSMSSLVRSILWKAVEKPAW